MKLTLLTLFSFFIFTSCTSVPVSEYRTAYPPQYFKSDSSFEQTYNLILDKMSHCYAQVNSGGVVEGTKGEMNSNKTSATITHGVSGMFGKNILFLIDVIPASTGSQISLYGKGDTFQTTDDLSNHLKKWLKNEKSTCRGRGEI